MSTSTKKETMTKKRLVDSISEEQGLHPTDVKNVVQAFLNRLTHSLAKGERLEFRDFGVFEVVERRQKVGRNPRKAGTPIVIPAHRTVKFTPGKRMRSLVSKDKDKPNS